MSADTRPPKASLSRRALRRQNPRQEPSAVIPHAGICAGAARKGGPYRDQQIYLTNFRRRTLDEQVLDLFSGILEHGAEFGAELFSHPMSRY
jgi:hypothetical protein